MKPRLEEIGLAELNVDQLEELCKIGEQAARSYILSKIPAKRISTLDIAVDTEGSKPVTVNVEVEVALSSLMKDCDIDKLVAEATERAFEAVGQYLRELSCTSKR